MPAKARNKSKVNGFWLFAQKNKSAWKAQGMKINSNDQLMAIAAPLWKALSQAERQGWDRQAREEQRLRSDETGDMGRLDNMGNVIGTRRDLVEEARRRRERELDMVTCQWQGKDLTQEPFYFINFQEMCELTDSDNTVDREWLPRELAMVEYTLKNGITQFYHQFIWPGDIPIGFRYHAETVSSEIHKIPIERIEEDSDEYRKIWKKMLQLVSAGVKDGQYPPLYCLGIDYEKMKYLSDWMWMKSMDSMSGATLGDNPLGKIYCIEDMVIALLASSGRPGTESVAKAQVTAQLDGSQWEYIPATTCEFHKKMDVSRHCALAVVRRTAYTISDMVGIHYGIDLSEQHVPIRSQEDTPGVARILPPNAVPLFGTRKSRGRRRERPAESARPSAASSYSQLARPGLGMERGIDAEEEEEFVGREIMEEERLQAPNVPHSDLLRGVQFIPRKYNEASPPPAGPASGQFDDSVWPQLGGGRASADQEALGPEEDFPALTVSKMTLSDNSSTWLATGGRGITTASTASPLLQPSPGFGLAGRGLGKGSQPEVAGIGRGLPVSGGAPSQAGWALGSTTADSAPPLGRGTSQQLGKGPSLTGIGRGVVPPGVGRGAGRGQMPAVGRGAMPAVGRGEMLAAGRSAVAHVGRGEMPLMGRGTAPNAGGGEMPDSSKTHQPPSHSPPPSVNAYEHSDDLNRDEFEPQPSGDFPSLRGGRGVAPGARGMGPSVGRGYNPNRGRGYAPMRGTAQVGRGSLLPTAGRGGDADWPSTQQQ